MQCLDDNIFSVLPRPFFQGATPCLFLVTPCPFLDGIYIYIYMCVVYSLLVCLVFLPLIVLPVPSDP